MPIEAAPSKHGVAQGFFLYGFEPGGNRIEVTTWGYFVYDPEHEPVILERGRARPRPVLGRQDRRELPLLRHAADARGRPIRAPLLREHGGVALALGQLHRHQPRELRAAADVELAVDLAEVVLDRLR